jgi:DNA replication protein DnaC
VVLLGPRGTGKTHLAIGLGIKAAQAGQRVLFATATDWVTRLQEAHHAGHLTHEIARLRRYGLLIVDEVGYIPSTRTPRTCSSSSSQAPTNTPH